MPSVTFELRTRPIESGPDKGRFVVEEWIDGTCMNSFGPIPGEVVERFIELRRGAHARKAATVGYTRIIPPRLLT